MEHVRNWSSDDEDSNSSWLSPLTLFELNHGDKTVGEDGKERENPLFYADLRSDNVALSDDGRFVGMCWYEDILDNDWTLGYRHSLNPNGNEEGDGGDDNDSSGIYWKELSDDEIHNEYAIDVGPNRSIQFTHFRDHHPGWHGHFWPCSILSKNKRKKGDDGDEDRYLVRIFPSDYHFVLNGDEAYMGSAVHLLLKNYPRSSIRFVTVPYEGDQYHPKAFHHHIEIKDELFPEQWRNKI